MDPSIHDTGDFISYPMGRVVGSVADAGQTSAAIESLLQAGIERKAIEVLHGDKGMHRLDPTGSEHGFLAKLQRTVIRLAGPAEEYAYLRHHVEDLRAGRYLLMVLTSNPESRDLVAKILNAHGAAFIGFFGTWAWSSMAASRPHGHI
jgi:hypothetical protein